MVGDAADAADPGAAVGDLLREARAGLPGVEEGAREAELLLAHVLGWERQRLLLAERVSWSPERAAEFRGLLRRRAAGEPLAYLLGHWEFFGRSFRTGPGVLIPRPETETLVEEALARRPQGRVADVGTGSGAIAITLALEVPGLTQVLAVDLSAEALRVARQNQRMLAPERPIHFLQGDLLGPIQARRSLDLVVSNLPYVEERERGMLAVDVRDHEPSLALFPVGETVDQLRRRLIRQAAGRLRPGGALLLEVGAGQAGRARDDFLAAGWRQVVIRNDLAGIGRVVAATCP